MSLIIKICGNTHVTDALAAVNSGADALGFIFYEPSPRHTTPALAKEIVRTLPSSVAKAGVFVDSREELVRAIAAGCGLDTLQFHGQESPEFCSRFSDFKVWKAFRIQDEKSLMLLERYETDAWLLDSFVAGKIGGTGAQFNWELARAAKKIAGERPIILAGGLSVGNVAEAVRQVRPFGIDVSSGVESRPGRKDHAKIKAFIEAARGAL